MNYQDIGLIIASCSFIGMLVYVGYTMAVEPITSKEQS